MDEQVSAALELRTLTGSLIPITMMPRTISADGIFVLELTPTIPGVDGSNILTVIAVNSGTVPQALPSLSIGGVNVRLKNEFANAFQVDFRASGTVLVEGKVVSGKTVQFAVIGETGHVAISIRGRDSVPPSDGNG